MTAAGNAPPKAAIVTVDDDPAVSRAVARDLRRRYGERLPDRPRRVRRPRRWRRCSELKLRGEPVAVLLADHRMPRDDRHRVPRAGDGRLSRGARRVLLTAYADTEAAIQAINDVDLDYYLLKPWDPPEEKLYPVVDDLLDDVAARRDHGRCRETQVVGHRWSARSLRGARLPGPQPRARTAGSTSTSPRARRLLDGGRASTTRALPLVITAGRRRAGRARPTPSSPTRSGCAPRPADGLLRPGGRRRRPGRARRGRLRRLGGCARCWSSARRPAGRPARARASRTTSASPTASPAPQLTDRAAAQARKFGAEMLTARDVVGLERDGPARAVRFADGGESTRTRCSWPPASPTAQLDGAGRRRAHRPRRLLRRRRDRGADVPDEDVYVVGGANSAGQAAVYFARYAQSVTLLVRGDRRSRRRCRTTWSSRSRAIDNIEVRTCTEVVGGRRRRPPRAAHAARPRHRRRARRSTPSWLFVFIGAAPRTDWLDGVVARDARGFVAHRPDLSPTASGPRLAARARPVPPGDQRARACSPPATSGPTR